MNDSVGFKKWRLPRCASSLMLVVNGLAMAPAWAESPWDTSLPEEHGLENPLLMASGTGSDRRIDISPAVPAGAPQQRAASRSAVTGPSHRDAPKLGGDIIVVSNANDAGTGSLRQAIILANVDPAFSRIEFNVPQPSGQCLLLSPESPYPLITASVLIDGTTQPGSIVNTQTHGNNANVCVRIVSFSDSNSHAFDVPASVNSTVEVELKGIAFGNFINAVRLQGGRSHRVGGCHFGTGLTDFFPGNGTGLVVSAPDTVIGGNSPADRNVFAGNWFSGISVNVGGNVISNNYIGTSRDGLATSSGLANGFGVLLQALATDNIVANNLISGNDTGVIAVGAADGNTIQDNRIGLQAGSPCGSAPFPACNLSMGNGTGIMVDHAASTRVIGNAIAYNASHGVMVWGAVNDTTHFNRVIGNALYSNGALGIDLREDGQAPGPDPIHDGTPTTGPNQGQNTAEVSFAGGGRREGRVRGGLRSEAGTYRVDLFSSSDCDASGFGEGEVHHGSEMLTLTSNPGAFDLPIGGPDNRPLAGRVITLTITDADGNTSEFSACRAYVCDQIFAHGLESVSADTCPAP